MLGVSSFESKAVSLRAHEPNSIYFDPQAQVPKGRL